MYRLQQLLVTNEQLTKQAASEIIDKTLSKMEEQAFYYCSTIQTISLFVISIGHLKKGVDSSGR